MLRQIIRALCSLAPPTNQTNWTLGAAARSLGRKVPRGQDGTNELAHAGEALSVPAMTPHGANRLLVRRHTRLLATTDPITLIRPARPPMLAAARST